jgi:anti-sigma B factor antagonist
VRETERALEIQDAVAGGRHMLVLSGELDIRSGVQLAGTIRRICSSGTTGIVLNLAKLTFIDSSGLAAVLAAGKICEEHGHEFMLIPGGKKVQQVFELTGLAHELPFEHTHLHCAVNPGSRRKGANVGRGLPRGGRTKNSAALPR